MDTNSAKPVNAQPAFKDITMEVREHSAQEANKEQSIWGRPLRMRGGGAAKDCLMAFACFEICKGCCDCIADIICCPCEACC